MGNETIDCLLINYYYDRLRIFPMQKNLYQETIILRIRFSIAYDINNDRNHVCSPNWLQVIYYPLIVMKTQFLR